MPYVQNSLDDHLLDFNQVLSNLWDFQVDSQNICQNWIKAYENQQLTQNDLQNYKQIIIILSEIINLIEEIKTKIYYEQLKKLEIMQKVKLLVGNQLNINPDKVTGLADIAYDLGADSLDILVVVMNIEQTFGIKLNDELNGTFPTIGKLIVRIYRKLNLTSSITTPISV
ncbi:MAG: phosphopantetheine-binding protein [Nostoc sp.]|uniref:acyl carrier protein n=1 Tax=Nostoc sp. TaxID=1180 RepID=UPI002FF9145D